MKFLTLIAFLMLLNHANGQHTLKNFSGNSDFDNADVTIQNSCSGKVKTKGKVTLDASLISLNGGSITCASNVTFGNIVTLKIKGSVLIRTNQLTITSKIAILFEDNDSRLTIEYAEMDENANSATREFSILKFKYAQLIITQKPLVCD